MIRSIDRVDGRSDRVVSSDERVHLTLVIPTLNKVETAFLIGRRVLDLLPDLQLEVIVVTPAREGMYVSAHPSIRVIDEVKRGVYAAYRQGIESAKGEYVWLLGDDDYPLDGVATLSDTLRQGIADLVVCPVVFSSGTFYKPNKSRFFLLLRNWCQQGVIYRRSVIIEHRFFRRLKIQADHYVNIKLYADESLRKIFCGAPICVFGVSGLSSRVKDEKFWRLRPLLARRTLSIPNYLFFQVFIHLVSRFKRALRDSKL